MKGQKIPFRVHQSWHGLPLHEIDPGSAFVLSAWTRLPVALAHASHGTPFRTCTTSRADFDGALSEDAADSLLSGR